MGIRNPSSTKRQKRIEQMYGLTPLMELSYVAVLPPKYHPLIAENQPKILKIIVTENQPSQLPASLN